MDNIGSKRGAQWSSYVGIWEEKSQIGEAVWGREGCEYLGVNNKFNIVFWAVIMNNKEKSKKITK